MEILINYLNVIKKDICNAIDYKTCSSKKEYFYWYLFVVVVSFIIAIIVGFLIDSKSFLKLNQFFFSNFSTLANC